VIKLKEGKLYGYNSDYYGFETSLFNWLPQDWQGKALILGTGGASLAVAAVLNDRGVPFQSVSRNGNADKISYQDAKERDLLSTHQLIINTTPLGMQPLVEAAPNLNYDRLGGGYYLFDLIYNPEITTFMQHGQRRGAKVKNGLEMLELQAEKSWEIWTGNL
jgi:shikimate dehydrogenase